MVKSWFDTLWIRLCPSDQIDRLILQTQHDRSSNPSYWIPPTKRMSILRRGFTVSALVVTEHKRQYAKKAAFAYFKNSGT